MQAYNNPNYNSSRQVAVENKKRFAKDIAAWLKEEGLHPDQLKAKLVSLMEGGETRFIRLKGAVNPGELEANTRVICTTGEIKKEKRDGETEEVFSDGETLIGIQVHDRELQRKALDMALRVNGMYAADQLELSIKDDLERRLNEANARALKSQRERTAAHTEAQHVLDL